MEPRSSTYKAFRLQFFVIKIRDSTWEAESLRERPHYLRICKYHLFALTGAEN